ncbi:MAG: stage III sporulation protein AD [Christensenellales bacterium]|jgi:stage III sporulation protein AD
MVIIQVAVIGIIATVLAVVLRKDRPEYALQIGIAAGVIILFLVIGSVSEIVRYVSELAATYHIDTAYVGVVVKIIGVAYIAEFAAQICKDAGENSIASKVELVGKVLICLLALPIMKALIDTITGILPGG